MKERHNRDVVLHGVTRDDIRMVEGWARWWLLSRGWYDEDILGAAREGLADASRTWDRDGGESFRNWCYRKVMQYIVSECRVRWGRRGQRNQFFISMDEVDYRISENPTDAIVFSIYHDDYIKSIDNVRKSRYIRYMFDGLTMKEVGELEGVGESAVHQSLKPVLEELKCTMC